MNLDAGILPVHLGVRLQVCVCVCVCEREKERERERERETLLFDQQLDAGTTSDIEVERGGRGYEKKVSDTGLYRHALTWRL